MPRDKYTKYLVNPHRIYDGSHRTRLRFAQNLRRETHTEFGRFTQNLEFTQNSKRVFTQNEVHTELRYVIHTELSLQRFTQSL